MASASLRGQRSSESLAGGQWSFWNWKFGGLKANLCLVVATRFKAGALKACEMLTSELVTHAAASTQLLKLSMQTMHSCQKAI